LVSNQNHRAQAVADKIELSAVLRRRPEKAQGLNHKNGNRFYAEDVEQFHG
jgi:hypothetical protein